MKELVFCIKVLAKRKSNQSRVLTISNLIFDLEARKVKRAGKEINLTRVNLKLLEILMRKSPDLVSKSDIEDVLWPDDTPQSNNLKVQLYQLRQKIDKPFTEKLIETVSGHGFRIKGD